MLVVDGPDDARVAACHRHLHVELPGPRGGAERPHLAAHALAAKLQVVLHRDLATPGGAAGRANRDTVVGPVVVWLGHAHLVGCAGRPAALAVPPVLFIIGPYSELCKGYLLFLPQGD